MIIRSVSLLCLWLLSTFSYAASYTLDGQLISTALYIDGSLQSSASNNVPNFSGSLNTAGNSSGDSAELNVVLGERSVADLSQAVGFDIDVVLNPIQFTMFGEVDYDYYYDYESYSGEETIAVDFTSVSSINPAGAVNFDGVPSLTLNGTAVASSSSILLWQFDLADNTVLCDPCGFEINIISELQDDYGSNVVLEESYWVSATEVPLPASAWLFLAALSSLVLKSKRPAWLRAK